MARFLPHYSLIDFRVVLPYMSEKQLARLSKILPAVSSLYIALFPYLCGDANAPGNISLYARGRDYHTVVMRFLTSKMRRLHKTYPDNRFAALVDASPLPEVTAAAAAGLGYIGRHGLLICPEYGSYVFIGIIASDRMLDGPAAEVLPQLHPACAQCTRCLSACPSAHLHDSALPCLSAVTQKKGNLTAREEILLTKSNSIWGCDTCQRACPLNQAVHSTSIRDFTEDLLSFLSRDMLDNMTEATFKRRAFCFRGRQPLLRNLEIVKR